MAKPNLSDENPFRIGVLATDDHFANRESEVARIAQGLSDAGGKLIVYGDRRLGKSSALERAAAVARKNGRGVAIASLATASDPVEAAQRVLSSFHLEIGRSWKNLFEDVTRSLNVSIEVSPPLDSVGPSTLKFGFGVQRPAAETLLLPQVLDAIEVQLAKRGKMAGLGLDEFQRIHEWGGEDAEWALRDSMQRHRSIGYVLAGSKRSLIEAMVTDKGRAFWKIADTLSFGPIDAEVMADWITEQAQLSGVVIPPDASRLMCQMAAPRTRDIVQLARGVWFAGKFATRIDRSVVLRAFEQLVLEQSELYHALWGRLGGREQSVLRAYAAESDVQITSAKAIKRFNLGPKSSVQSTVGRLVEAEHLTKIATGSYVYDDPFFRRFVQVNGLPDIGEGVPPLSVT